MKYRTTLYIPLTYETALDYLSARSYETPSPPCNYIALFNGSLFFTLLDGLQYHQGQRRRSKGKFTTNSDVSQSSSAASSFVNHDRTISSLTSLLHRTIYGIFSCSSTVFYDYFLPYPHYRRSFQQTRINEKNTDDESFHFRDHIFLWFPANYYQHPDYVFSYYLNRTNNLYVRIERENAYISSLGGGAYLCRHIPLAIQAAYTQLYLSSIINDIILFTRSIVHLIYIAIAAGQWCTANRIIRVLLSYGDRTNDQGLMTMVRTAQHYLFHTKRWYRSGILNLSPINIIHKITKPAILSSSLSSSSSSSFSISAPSSIHDSNTDSPSSPTSNERTLPSVSTTQDASIPEEQYRNDPRYDDIYRQRITRYRGRII